METMELKLEGRFNVAAFSLDAGGASSVRTRSNVKPSAVSVVEG